MKQVPITATLIVKARDKATAVSLTSSELNKWFVRDVTNDEFPEGSLLHWSIEKVEPWTPQQEIPEVLASSKDDPHAAECFGPVLDGEGFPSHQTVLFAQEMGTLHKLPVREWALDAWWKSCGKYGDRFFVQDVTDVLAEFVRLQNLKGIAKIVMYQYFNDGDANAGPGTPEHEGDFREVLSWERP